MTVMSNEDPADPSTHEPRVTGSPDAIWLVYGELEHDDTHANCVASGEVTWCEDAQFTADVRYTRTDLVAERVRAAVAAEREQCEKLLGAEPENPGLADKGPWEACLGTRPSQSGDVPCAIVASNGFEHDVWMYVTGDFVDLDQAFKYAQGIARRLNTTAPNAEVTDL